MSRPLRLLQAWAPALVWMAVIFSASGDAGSAARSSRILAPLLHWLFPALAEETVAAVVYGVRKTAHVLEYAVLALLVWRARRRTEPPPPAPWSWRRAGWAWLVATAWAASDEVHQLLVPSREGRARDVALDAVGAALGLLALRAWGRWRRWW